MGVRTLSGLDDFLNEYPGMSTVPHSGLGVLLRGKFRFKAKIPEGLEIKDDYRLEILVPRSFPQALPVIKEIDGKIPRDGKYHVNRDGSLCTGSPLRLLMISHEVADFNTFINKSLVPYLYAVSNKLRNGGDFVFGELAHGERGIVEDYSEILGLKNRSKVIKAIQLLGFKKRIANKKPCPCGCDRRLGVCSFHYKLNRLRKIAPVSWFKEQALGAKP